MNAYHQSYLKIIVVNHNTTEKNRIIHDTCNFSNKDTDNDNGKNAHCPNSIHIVATVMLIPHDT